mmetsp:Transcript_18266/g.48224  ORF Transcript_18266/g.48224 Transcript_18266/m.48224 type:complete len:221 (-) Transcript_18266:482-1144(-)
MPVISTSSSTDGPSSSSFFSAAPPSFASAFFSSSPFPPSFSAFSAFSASSLSFFSSFSESDGFFKIVAGFSSALASASFLPFGFSGLSNMRRRPESSSSSLSPASPNFSDTSPPGSASEGSRKGSMSKVISTSLLPWSDFFASSISLSKSSAVLTPTPSTDTIFQPTLTPRSWACLPSVTFVRSSELPCRRFQPNGLFTSNGIVFCAGGDLGSSAILPRG